MHTLLRLAAATLQGGTPGASNPNTSAGGLLHYTLPPDKLAQAYALYRIDVSLYFIATLYIFLVLWLMLRLHYGARLRDFAERVSRFWLVRAAVVIALFFVTLEVLQLPFLASTATTSAWTTACRCSNGVRGSETGRKDWGSAWSVAIILGWILYGMLRRSPQRWWFYFWLVTIPFLLFAIFIQPILIDPLFNKFEPLTEHHPELVDQIASVVHRAGMDIPPSRMYLMKASEKTNELNAYVTGFGSSKRVVVWDTTMSHMTIPQTMFVFGHEMGHYVLGHLVKGFVITVALLLFFFYFSYRIANWLMRTQGRPLGHSPAERLRFSSHAAPNLVRAVVRLRAGLQCDLTTLRASGRPVRARSRSRIGAAARADGRRVLSDTGRAFARLSLRRQVR